MHMYAIRGALQRSRTARRRVNPCMAGLRELARFRIVKGERREPEDIQSLLSAQHALFERVPRASLTGSDRCHRKRAQR